MNPTMSETHLLPKSKLFPKINLPSLQHQPEINNQIISSSSTSKISLSSHVYKSDSLFLTATTEAHLTSAVNLCRLARTVLKESKTQTQT